MKALFSIIQTGSNRAIGLCLGLLIAAGQLSPADAAIRRWTGVKTDDNADGDVITLSSPDGDVRFKIDKDCAAKLWSPPPKKTRAKKKLADPPNNP